MKNDGNVAVSVKNQVAPYFGYHPNTGSEGFKGSYQNIKKFENIANKINAIKNVFRDGERLKGKEIVTRLQESGYNVKERNILMFIYHRMLYKHVQRKVINGINIYTLA